MLTTIHLPTLRRLITEQVLGEPADKLPRDFRFDGMVSVPFDHQGSTILGRFRYKTMEVMVIRSSTPPGERATKRAMNHRVFVRCPICQEMVPAGRIRQHRKRIDHKDHAEFA